VKTQKGKYVPIGTSFAVAVPKNVSKVRFEWEPAAVYITHDRVTTHLHYAGDRAGESAAIFALPTDADFLRRLASALVELAQEYPDREA
jgi:hypothetical protein